MLNSYEILGGRDLTDTNYTNWDDYADPILNSTELNCMQLLSGTIYNGTWMPRDCNDAFNKGALCQLK